MSDDFIFEVYIENGRGSMAIAGSGSSESLQSTVVPARCEIKKISKLQGLPFENLRFSKRAGPQNTNCV